MPIQLTCPSCSKRLQVGDDLAGRKIRCPNCKAIADVPAASPPPKQPSTVNLDAVPPAPSGPAAPKLPPTMKANKALAGQICIGCAAAIKLGDDLRNCQECMTPHHAACWEGAGGCGVEGCAGSPKSAAAPEKAAGPTRACPFCSETIPLKAKKCPKCREWVDPTMRARAPAAGASIAASYEIDEAKKLARDSMIAGIVGLICCGIILGPFALYKGFTANSKLSQLGQPSSGMATAGIVLGFIDILGAIAGVMIQASQR